MADEPQSEVPDGGLSLLVNRGEAARLMAVSIAMWDRMVAAGKTPRPIVLGRLVRWRRSDLESWIKFGCPDRKAFDALIENE